MLFINRFTQSTKCWYTGMWRIRYVATNQVTFPALFYILCFILYAIYCFLLYTENDYRGYQEIFRLRWCKHSQWNDTNNCYYLNLIKSKLWLLAFYHFLIVIIFYNTFPAMLTLPSTIIPANTHTFTYYTLITISTFALIPLIYPIWVHI